MDLTPSQQERYLEMASSYDSFVQQVRQHKAEALARIGRVSEGLPFVQHRRARFTIACLQF